MDVGKTIRIRVYLSDAASFIKEAEAELSRGVQERGNLRGNSISCV